MTPADFLAAVNAVNGAAGQEDFIRILSAQWERVRDLAMDDDLVKDGRKFVANNDWRKFLSGLNGPPKLVVVADNPGTKEAECGVYLHPEGGAGPIARQFLDAASNSDAMKSGWAIALNKSSFYTPDTEELSAFFRRDDLTPALQEAQTKDQQWNGRTVARIAGALRIPILVVGHKKMLGFFLPFTKALRAEALKLARFIRRQAGNDGKSA